MGGKHLKRVRAEKSKVHLKKKTLPKGQNVTNTTFTVKKIVALEQLKKVDENEPVSNWNVPLKDLLIRLNHYNFTSRQNSLVGIKELLKKYPEILNGPHLKSLIERLLELITDVEQKIRITTINLLSNIFERVPPNSIIPFYDVSIVHLVCAMTHRTASIQQDSLKFIDVLIKYTPEAVKNNFKSITQNFARILKNTLHESHSNVFLSKGSEQNLEKTKTDILNRFYQFLAAGFEPHSNTELSKCHEKHILAQQNVPLRSVINQYKQIPDLSLLSKISVTKEKSLTENDSEEFKSLCLLVMPLLFDTWREFCPNSTGSESVVSEETGGLLLILLRILLLFYEKAVALKNVEVEHWFMSNYGRTFKKSFTPNFPYNSATNRISDGIIHNESYEKNSNDFLSLNLIICYLSYSFNIVKKNSQIESKMENYLINVLLMKNQTEIEILLKVVEAVVNVSKQKKSNVFINYVVKAYKTSNHLELKLGFSKALLRIVLDENNLNNMEDHSIKQWLKSLPECLCKAQIFSQEIQTLLKIINKPIGHEILQEIEHKCRDIVLNLPKIKMVGINQLEGQKLIADILYRCDNKVLEELVQDENLINALYPPELKNYILSIFYQKLNIRPTECI